MAIIKDSKGVYNPHTGGIDRVEKYREVSGDPKRGQSRKSRLIGQKKFNESGKLVYERGNCREK